MKTINVRTFIICCVGFLAACNLTTDKIDLSQSKVSSLEDSIYYAPDSILKMIAAANNTSKAAVVLTKEESIAQGEALYSMTCISCHQANGQGLPGTFPPLAQSDYFSGDINKAIHVVKNGLSGTVTVNGNSFNNVMPNLGLKDEDIANVLTYVMNSWGNSGAHITPADVGKVN